MHRLKNSRGAILRMGRGEDAARLVKSREYKEAMRRAADIRKRMASSNKFGLDNLLDETGLFFSGLKKKQPRIYEALGIQEKEIYEMAFRKKTGKDIIIG